MITRTLEAVVRQSAAQHPIVTLVGPRQSGKTTLCRALFPDKAYVSLERPDVRDRISTDPLEFLASLPETGAILDEVQRLPDLLSYIQVEVDARRSRGRFILTGSANLLLLESVSQSLAGRTALHTLLPCGLEELQRFAGRSDDELLDTLYTGGYPAIPDRDLDPTQWLGDYVETYVERDVRRVLRVGDLVQFRTFVRLCAGRTGQLLNVSALAADTGVTTQTVRAWLSVLEATYVVFRLPAFHANLRKRLIKAPKLHFYDTGLVCYLLGIRSAEQLLTHPLRGAIFETWVASEVAKWRLHRNHSVSSFHYRDRNRQEVDLVVDSGHTLTAVETKSGRTLASEMLRGLHHFGRLVQRDPLVTGRAKVVVYGGHERQRWTDVEAVPWRDVPAYDWD